MTTSPTPAAVLGQTGGLLKALHTTFVVLVLASAVRYLTGHGFGDQAPWMIAGALALLATYAAGPVLPGRVWLALLVVVWFGLVLLAPSFAWCAVPLSFVALRVLAFWPACAVVAGMVATVVVQWTRMADRLDPTIVLGPACIAVLAVGAYRALERDAVARQVLLDDLHAAQGDLADAQHQAGALAERARLSREIHDSVAQGLSSINLLLQAAEREWDARPSAAREHAALAATTARDGLDEVRRVVRDLAPAELAASGLGASGAAASGAAATGAALGATAPGVAGSGAAASDPAASGLAASATAASGMAASGSAASGTVVAGTGASDTVGAGAAASGANASGAAASGLASSGAADPGVAGAGAAASGTAATRANASGAAAAGVAGSGAAASGQPALPGALRQTCERLAAVSDVDVRVQVHGTPVSLGPEVETALLRTARGALANVLEHSAATTAVVTLTYQPDSVVLDVRDDGRGLANRGTTAPDRGRGLAGMRDRLSQLGGTLILESEPGEGTALAASIPLKATRT
ncbi:sensor histidine kinase [Kribbella endophytica]